ncbi:flippase [Lacticaseibacillus paracasei]|uniref:flippase n=1 Tax=Lacticaseibacillus paracasei TaxID=1597 RepID=UPI004045FBDC
MKVIKNFLYNSGYQLLILMVPLLSTPYIARVIGTHGVGIYSYTYSVTQYFVIIASLGLSMFGSREIAYVRNDDSKRSSVLWGVIALQISLAIIVTIIFYLTVGIFAKYHLYFLIQGGQILYVATDISWYFVGLEDFRTVVVRNTLIKFSGLGLIFWLVKSPADLGTYMLILVGTSVLGNLTLWPFLHKTVVAPWHVNWNNPLRFLRPALVLFIPQIAIQVYLVLNKIMLGNMINVTASGIYDYSDRIIRTILAVVTSVGTVLLPHLAAAYSKNQLSLINKYFTKAVEAVAFLACPLAFGLAAIAPQFVLWFLGSNFVSAGPIVRIMTPLIVVLAYSSLFGSTLISINQNWGYNLSVIVGCLVNVIVNLFMIPLLGIEGAALSTIISETSVFVVQLIWLKRKHIPISSLEKIWKYMLMGLIMGVCVFGISALLSNSFTSILLEVAVGALLYILGGLLLKFPIFIDARALIVSRRKSH